MAIYETFKPEMLYEPGELYIVCSHCKVSFRVIIEQEAIEDLRESDKYHCKSFGHRFSVARIPGDGGNG